MSDVPSVPSVPPLDFIGVRGNAPEDASAGVMTADRTDITCDSTTVTCDET